MTLRPYEKCLFSFLVCPILSYHEGFSNIDILRKYVKCPSLKTLGHRICAFEKVVLPEREDLKVSCSPVLCRLLLQISLA